MSDTPETILTDYHQKPVSDMTKGELRAYRRELARAAFAHILRQDYSDPIAAVWNRADQMIDYERREEREGDAE